MKQIQYHNNIPYKVHRTIPRHNFVIEGKENLQLVQMWRDYLDCDHVLQNADYFIFCETVHEVEFEEVEHFPQ